MRNWSAVMDEAVWCRQQLRSMESKMDIEKALQIAQHCNDEGIISTSALALRCLAEEYLKLKQEKDARDYVMFERQIDYIRNKHGNPE